MKQNLPPANARGSRVVHVLTLIATCILLVSIGSACVTIPRSSSFAVQGNSDAAKADTGSLTNINSAGTDELEKLPGVGRVIAERIIAHREQYGRFRRAEHLMMVRGISDRRFREIRPMIVAE